MHLGGLEPVNLPLPIQFVGNPFAMTIHLNHFFFLVYQMHFGGLEPMNVSLPILS